MERILGRSGIPISALGLGCWAIGGPFLLDGKPDGWGTVDDAESVRAIRGALDLGVRFFDTADVYGAGHSERVLGRAIARCRDDIVISTKFGYTFDPQTKRAGGTNASVAYIRAACEASLRRLDTDYIDLYHLHIWSLPEAQAAEVASVLEALRCEGKIRAYGWSTDDLDCARVFAQQPGCAAIQHQLNVLDDAPELIEICDAHDLASINRTPLAMGLLSGKFDASVTLPCDDVRGAGHQWVRYFVNATPSREALDRLATIRDILTSNGRTAAQGALAWIWSRSERTIPIPGFKTVAQAEENARALAFGPLTTEQLSEIELLLGRTATTERAVAS